MVVSTTGASVGAAEVSTGGHALKPNGSSKSPDCATTKFIKADRQNIFIFGFVFLSNACTYKLISLLGTGQGVRAP